MKIQKFSAEIEAVQLEKENANEVISWIKSQPFVQSVNSCFDEFLVVQKEAPNFWIKIGDWACKDLEERLFAHADNIKFREKYFEI